jgi:hypothetical protein
MFHRPYDDVAAAIFKSGPEMELLRAMARSPEAKLMREIIEQAKPFREMVKHCEEVARVGAGIFSSGAAPFSCIRERRGAENGRST